MSKVGAPRKEWMSEDEVITFLNSHISRTQRVFDGDNGAITYTDLELESIEVFEFFYACTIKKWLEDAEHPLFYKVNELTTEGIISWYLTLVDGLENEKYISIEECNNSTDVKCKCLIDMDLWHKDLDLHSNLCDAIDAELDILVSIKRHYMILSDYLINKGIENNIGDYCLSLAGEGFYEVIKHIKIEKRPIFTPRMTEEMKRKLCKSEFGCRFDISECFKLINDGLRPLVVVNCVSHFVYLMQELEKRGLVYDNWKSTLGKYKLARSCNDYKKYFSKQNLSPTLTQVNNEYATSVNSKVAKDYKAIRDFVGNL